MLESKGEWGQLNMTPARGDDGMERRIGKLEVDMGTITTRLNEVEKWVPESRTFHREMSTFKTTLLATQDAIREEQSRRHRANSWKLSVIMACIALGTLLIAIATFVIANWVHTHAATDPIKIMKSESLPEMAKYPEFTAQQ